MPALYLWKNACNANLACSAVGFLFKLHNVCDYDILSQFLWNDPQRWMYIYSHLNSLLPEWPFLLVCYGLQEHVSCLLTPASGETNGFPLQVAIPISAKSGGMGCFLDWISAHRLPVKHPSWSSAGKRMQCVATVTSSRSETWLSMWLVRTIMWAGCRLCLYHEGDVHELMSEHDGLWSVWEGVIGTRNPLVYGPLVGSL